MVLVNVLFNIPLFAQYKVRQERIDSLMTVLSKSQNDTNKVCLLTDLSNTASSIGEAEKGLTWANQALSLAIQLSYKKGEAKAYNALSANYWVKHDYLTEQKYLLSALSIHQELNNRAEIAKTIRSIGDIYETEYNYPKALEYYKQALTYIDDDNWDLDIFLAYVANIYDSEKQYKEALVYYQKAIKFCFSHNKVPAVGGHYRRIGLVFANQGDFINALKYEKKGFFINIRLKKNSIFKYQYKWSLRALGMVYFQKGDYEQSLVYFRKAFNEFKLLPDAYSKNDAGICLCKMGIAYLKIARNTAKNNPSYFSNLKHAEDILNIAIEWLKPRDWASLTEALQNLSTVYQLSGNHLEALKAYQQYSIYKDSLKNNEIEKKIIVQEMGYEYSRQKDSITRDNILHSTQLQVLVQQKELDNLRGKQQRIYIVLAFALVCLLATYFFYRNHVANKNLQGELDNERIGKQLQAAEHEKDISRTTLTALIAQMNPHFLFNALNTIQSFIYSNDKKNASSYLGKFSELTRKILDNSSKKNISLDEEITLLQLYLDIEKVRFGDGFDASIRVDPSLDGEGISFPPMLVQPYVENAIKNGLLHKQGKKELRVDIRRIDGTNGIKIVIDDNGIGREQSTKINKTKIGHQSFANTATQKRINLINQTLDQKIVLDIIDKKNENGIGIGTTVILIIP